VSKIFQTLVFLMLLATTCSAYAVDSYRYAHVTIESPLSIFIFLLMIILFPFILMAVFYWYFAVKKDDAKDAGHE